MLRDLIPGPATAFKIWRKKFSHSLFKSAATWGWFLLDDLSQQGRQALGLKRRPPGEQFVEHRAQGIDIARSRGLLGAARGHFWREVTRRAQQRGGKSQVGV